MFLPLFLQKVVIGTIFFVGIIPACAAFSQKGGEAIYNTWVLSLTRGDYEMWRDATAVFRQRMVRNQAISEKKKFPDSLFHLEMKLPSLEGLKYVGMVEKGATAAMTYFGKVDFGVGGNPSDGALVLLFVYENGEWKYDTSRYFNLGQLPAVKKRLAAGDATVLREQDGFQPTGQIPPSPALCPAPHYIAKIYVDCPGRRVVANINGISNHVFEDTRDAVVISGGLRGGQNTLSYTIEDAGRGTPSHFGLAVFIMPEVPGNIPGDAYHYVPAKDTVPQGAQTIINVNKDMLMKMQGPKTGGDKKNKVKK